MMKLEVIMLKILFFFRERDRLSRKHLLELGIRYIRFARSNRFLVCVETPNQIFYGLRSYCLFRSSICSDWKSVQTSLQLSEFQGPLDPANVAASVHTCIPLIYSIPVPTPSDDD